MGIVGTFKGTLDKYNTIPNFFPKKVGMGNDWMMSFKF